jgi:broad specificity phosphatase PhoE
MTKIYFVRHCEAEGNVKRIFQGLTDLDISELGAKQLKLLEKRFKNIPLDKIYSSPLLRAYKTALAVKGERQIEIEKHEGLIELNGGIVEGKPFAESFEKLPDLADAWDNHPEDFHPQDGEAMRDAYERIFNTVLDIASKNRGKTIACTTHGGVTRCLICRLLHGDIHKLKDTPWADNTGVACFTVDDNDNCTLEFYNDTTHLPPEYIPKRNRISKYMKVEK